MTQINSLFTALVNNKKLENISVGTHGFEINGASYEWDLTYLPDGRIHIIKGNRNYLVHILRLDRKTKEVTLQINHNQYRVILKDAFDTLLEKMGMASSVSTTHQSLQAPMPGQIVKIFVSEGEEVVKGDALVILKAMKMENILKAADDARIDKILIQPGDAVEKSQDLILFQ